MVGFSRHQQGRLEEYKALRAEILQWQSQRLRVLSLSVAIIAAVLAFFVGIFVKASADEQFSLALVGALAQYVVLIPLQMLLISSHQQIRRIGEYIREYVEPEIPGLDYENRLLAHRKVWKRGPGIRSLGLVYIALSLVPLVLPILTLRRTAANWPWYFVLLPFMVISLYFAIDLWIARSPGWRSVHWR